MDLLYSILIPWSFKLVFDLCIVAAFIYVTRDKKV